MKFLKFIKETPGHNHAIYMTNQGKIVRKPYGVPLEAPVTPTNFSQKWDTEKEPNLYVPAGQKPKTQRQFFYWKYWEFIDKFVFSKFPPALHHKLTSLDIGCGRATISQYLKHRVGMRELVMLDNDKSALELAKKNVGEGVFITSDVNDLPFQEETFDIIVSMGVVEHIEDYEKFFKEQYRVLKQWGIMACLIVPDKSSIQKFNIFGTQKYKRSATTIEQYKEATLKAGFPFHSGTWVAPYPIFTPIPKWLERVITSVYLLIDGVRKWLGRKKPSYYSFSGSQRWSQAFFLLSFKV